MNNSSEIFGNVIGKSTIKKAQRKKQKYLKKFGNDTTAEYNLTFQPIESLNFMKAQNIVLTSGETQAFPDNSIIVGTAKKSLQSYRYAISLMSCANSLGFKPFFIDVSLLETTGSKALREMNSGNRIISNSNSLSRFFISVFPSKNTKNLNKNAIDQATSELLTPLYKNIPKTVPYIATDVYASQSAIHGKMEKVVNCIFGNYSSAVNLSEGSIHAVETPFSYLGYKTLYGFTQNDNSGIQGDKIKTVGSVIGDEIVRNIKTSNEQRIKRINKNSPLRILLCIDGESSEKYLFIVKALLPFIRKNQITLFINFGTRIEVYDYIKTELYEFDQTAKLFFDKFDELKNLLQTFSVKNVEGIHAIFEHDIFQAVYSTDLLIPYCDLLITEPNELVFYPIPTLLLSHTTKEQKFNGIFATDVGTATFECKTKNDVVFLIDKLLKDKDTLLNMISSIEALEKAEFYNGGYSCIDLSTKKEVLS